MGRQNHLVYAPLQEVTPSQMAQQAERLQIKVDAHCSKYVKSEMREVTPFNRMIAGFNNNLKNNNNNYVQALKAHRCKATMAELY